MIEDAKKFIDVNDQSFEDLISDLETSRVTIEKERLEIEQYKAEVAQLKQKLETKQENLAKQKENILRQANEDARKILQDAKDYADQTIRDMNKLAAGKMDNMKEMENKMFIVERAADAMRKNGVVPEFVPIRGGTDGARLSFEGLPCPNLSTGGANYHSRYEYACVEDIETMVSVLCTILS